MEIGSSLLQLRFGARCELNLVNLFHSHAADVRALLLLEPLPEAVQKDRAIAKAPGRGRTQSGCATELRKTAST